jgi:hypothetical protein
MFLCSVAVTLPLPVTESESVMSTLLTTSAPAVADNHPEHTSISGWAIPANFIRDGANRIYDFLGLIDHFIHGFLSCR